MMSFRRVLLGALTLGGMVALVDGCTPGGDPHTLAIPMATLAPVHLTPCPQRIRAAALATHCPEVAR